MMAWMPDLHKQASLNKGRHDSKDAKSGRERIAL